MSEQTALRQAQSGEQHRTTTKEKLTLREVMASGQKGNFAAALYALHEAASSGDLLTLHDCLEHAYAVADPDNTERLHTAFRRGCTILDLRIAASLEAEWPGLARLDEPMDDPYAYDLTKES